MKKFLLGTLLGITLLAVVGYIFRDPLATRLEAAITGDMFVESDGDTYDPGLKVGALFPDIQGRTGDTTVNSIDRYIADRGMIFIAVRSADW